MQSLWMLVSSLFFALMAACVNVFAALLGLAIFGERLAGNGWLGIAIIMASCIAATALVARQPPPPILERSTATPGK